MALRNIWRCGFSSRCENPMRSIVKPYGFYTYFQPLPPCSVLSNEHAVRHFQAAIAQLAARRSHNPKVVSSILTRRIQR